MCSAFNRVCYACLEAPMNRTVLFWLVALNGAFATAQSTSPQSSSGWELLKRVGQHYANATSYHIEVTQEETSSNELQRHWEKTISDVSEAPNGKYRYEVRSGTGHVLRVSDGKQLWNYHYDEHIYSLAPDTGQGTGHGTTSAADAPLINAAFIRRELANLATTYKTAVLLPEIEVELNGKHIPCYVLRVMLRSRMQLTRWPTSRSRRRYRSGRRTKRY